MTDCALLDLDPRLQPIAQQFLDQCKAAGLKVRITVTWRSADEQGAAYDKGLSNAKAGESPHNCVDASGNPASRAFDFAIFDDDGSYIKDGKDWRYAEAGAIAEQLGLAWGGAWQHPDYDHCELRDWKSIN